MDHREIRCHIGRSHYLVESKVSLLVTLLHRGPMRLQAKAHALWDFGHQRLAVVANYVSMDATTEVRRVVAGEHI